MILGEPLEAIVKLEQKYNSDDDEDERNYSFHENFETNSEKWDDNQLPDCKPLEEELIKGALKNQLETLSNLAKSTCQACHKQFSVKQSFITHLKICNPSQLASIQENVAVKGTNGEASKENKRSSLSCRFCPRTFAKKKCLAKHEYQHQIDPENLNLSKNPEKNKRKTSGFAMPKV